MQVVEIAIIFRKRRSEPIGGKTRRPRRGDQLNFMDIDETLDPIGAALAAVGSGDITL
jgi:hypothetical protein